MTIPLFTRYQIPTADQLNAMVVAINNFNTFDASTYGAVGNGVVDDRLAIQAAIDAASASPFGGVVTFPAGLFRINRAVGALVAKSNVTLRGAGPNKTTIWSDDSTGEVGQAVLNNVSTYPNFTAITNFHMENIGFKGRGDVNKTPSAGQLVMLGNSDDFRITNCWFTYSRQSALFIAKAKRAVVTQCYFYRSQADGLDYQDVANAIVMNNEFYNTNDDAISIGTIDTTVDPNRSGTLVAGNVITEGQGIAVLGGKHVLVADNVLTRITAIAIRVTSTVSEPAGSHTSQFNCKVVNNTINDVIKRSEPSPRTGAHAGIIISGGPRDFGSAASAPGEPVVGTGVVTSLYGSNSVGTLYLNNSLSATVPQAAGYSIQVVGNIMQRTLPAVTTVSQWGYDASGLWVGNNGDGSGFYNGAITDASLSPTGIIINPTLHNCLIADNFINFGGVHGIEFSSAITVNNSDYRGLRIKNNEIIGFTSNGIRMPSTSTTHRIYIEDNIFDGDPLFVSANRAVARDGSWQVDGAGPTGIYALNAGGHVIARNKFRNVCNTISYGSGLSQGISLFDNEQYCQPSVAGFSTANKGIGNISRDSPRGWHTIVEDCDPQSATFGQLTSELSFARTVMPSAGFYMQGHVVGKPDATLAAGKTLVGWVRLTTGSNHVLNTDWAGLYVPNA